MTDFCHNRKASHEYHLLDTLEAGIVLIGNEVKSIRDYRMSLDGAYVTLRDNELWLINSHIDEYKNACLLEPYNPLRQRKLLLHRREINKFVEKSAQKGFTIIPLKVYLNKGRIKILLAIAKGKQLHDKREASKNKDAQREIRNV